MFVFKVLIAEIFREHLSRDDVGKQSLEREKLTWKCKMMVQMRPSVSFGLPAERFQWDLMWIDGGLKNQVQLAPAMILNGNDTCCQQYPLHGCLRVWFSWTAGNPTPFGRSEACGIAFFPFLEAKMTIAWMLALKFQSKSKSNSPNVRPKAPPAVTVNCVHRVSPQIDHRHDVMPGVISDKES